MFQSGMTKSIAGIILLQFCINAYSSRIDVFPEDGSKEINIKILDLSAGDTMVFNPGSYKGPFVLKNVMGLPNLPVVIKGVPTKTEAVIIDGKSEPGIGLDNNAFNLIYWPAQMGRCIIT